MTSSRLIVRIKKRVFEGFGIKRSVANSIILIGKIQKNKPISFPTEAKASEKPFVINSK
jgi:hypothetical protein